MNCHGACPHVICHLCRLYAMSKLQKAGRNFERQLQQYNISILDVCAPVVRTLMCVLHYAMTVRVTCMRTCVRRAAV